MATTLKTEYTPLEQVAIQYSIGHVFADYPDLEAGETYAKRFVSLITTLEKDEQTPDEYVVWSPFADEPPYTLARILEQTYVEFLQFAHSVKDVVGGK